MKTKKQHDLYVNMVIELQKNGASDKEVFALLLSLCTDYLSQILDILEEKENDR